MTWRKGLRFFTLLVLCGLLQACGYRLGNGLDNGQGLCLYVEGDFKGVFEDAIVEELTLQGFILKTGSPLCLTVRLFPRTDENIGFRRNKNNQGKLENTLTPSETRAFAMAEIALYYEGEESLPPVRILASFDFDHNGLGNLDALNVFSLGQLSSREEALVTADKPLFSLLAKKIVATLTWNLNK